MISIYYEFSSAGVTIAIRGVDDTVSHSSNYCPEGIASVCFTTAKPDLELW